MKGLREARRQPAPTELNAWHNCPRTQLDADTCRILSVTQHRHSKLCNECRWNNRWKVLNSPCGFHFKVQHKSGQVWAYCRDSITTAASTTEQQLWRQTEQPLNSIEKNNQNNVGHTRLETSLRECLRRVFVFRKWTPQCVTLPTILLSHTQVLKWSKLFPAYHILPQRQQHWQATPKGKQTNPKPKGCNSNVTSTTKREVCKKTHRELGWLQGRQKGSRGRKREGKAVKDKERTPGKANCLLLFLLFFTFPKLHKLTTKYLLTESDLYKVVYFPLHIQRTCNSTKRWLNQVILTLCEFQHFCFLWPHILELILFPKDLQAAPPQQCLTHCPIQSLLPIIRSEVSWQLERLH